MQEEGSIRLKQPSTEKDFTDEINKFSQSFLSELKEIDGFILKGRSPSCGVNGVKVYPSMEKSPVAFEDV